MGLKIEGFMAKEKQVTNFDMAFICLTKEFRKVYKCFYISGTSMVYVRNDKNNYIYVTIIRTSVKCYRVISCGYAQYNHKLNFSEYKTFNYQYELAHYLNNNILNIEF